MPWPSVDSRTPSSGAISERLGESIGRRERKKLETRRAIARAALTLAQELGPDSVTIENISEAADVSPRTVFNHFASKEDAILGVDPSRVEDLRARFAARPTDEPPLHSLRAVLLDSPEELTTNVGEWRQRVRIVREHPASLYARYVSTFAAHERALTELVATRLGVNPDHDLRPALLVASAFAAVRVATDTWETSDRSVRLEDLIEEAFRHLDSGLA